MQTLNTLHRNNRKKFPALLPDHSSLQIFPVISMIRLGKDCISNCCTSLKGCQPLADCNSLQVSFKVDNPYSDLK